MKISVGPLSDMLPETLIIETIELFMQKESNVYLQILSFIFSVAKATLQPPMSVRPSVCLKPKPPNSLKSIIPPYHNIHHHSHHHTQHLKHHHNTTSQPSSSSSISSFT